MEEEDNILVSVIVIAYNSSRTVLETLESVKVQTYGNIELIVTDDCSADDTVDICRDWIAVNKSRFVRAELLTVDYNTGVPANCNRGLKCAQGKWLKFIAADDVLLPNCIKDDLKFALEHKDCYILQTDEELYQNEIRPECRIKQEDYRNKMFLDSKYFDLQHQIMLYCNPVFSPTVFIKKELFDKVGCYDEDIRLLEDLPFYLKLTQRGFHFFYNSIKTVCYRLNDNSIMASNHIDKRLFNVSLSKSSYISYKRYRKPFMGFFGFIISEIHYRLMFYIEKIDANNQKSFWRIPFALSSKIFCDYRFCHLKRLENGTK
jgi:alpha-1,3-rhamnosyltransferase